MIGSTGSVLFVIYSEIEMRVFLTTVLAICFALEATTAEASIASTGLLNSGLQNGFNSLEDDDFETLGLDQGTLGIIDAGDRFFGAFRIQSINGNPLGSGDATITAIFAFEVLSTNATLVGGGDATEIVLGPLQSGGVNAASTEFALFAASLGVTTTTPTDDATAALLFAHPDISVTDPGAGSLGASIDTFDETSGAEFIGEFGDGGEVFLSTITSPIPGIDNPLASPTPFLGDGDITLNFDLLVDNPADTLFLGNLFGQGDFVDVLTPTAGGAGPPLGDPGDFQLVTDTNFASVGTIITPEPTTFLVWGGLLGMIISRSRHRLG